VGPSDRRRVWVWPDDLFYTSAEPSPTPLVVVDEAGGIAEEVGGSYEQATGERAHLGRLPVVGDDAVSITEEVGELVDVQQHGGDVP
jgi:hypothetical protein